MQFDNYRYILITGATASGKSSLALRLAQKYDAVIVNCDSMQIYEGLNILSAAPNAEACATAQHLLYNYVSVKTAYSVGAWLADVERVIADISPAGKIIFVGGTGLYFKALLGELAAIPPIAESIRQKWRARSLVEKSEDLHKLLNEVDSKMAQKLMANDAQRIVRALEVWESSGKSLSYWHSVKRPGLIDSDSTAKLVLSLERQILYSRIEKRCETFLNQPVLEEVRNLLAMQLNFELPAMRAIGVREFAAYINGQITLKEALILLKTHTRQYAKRQLTWQRHKLDASWQLVAE